MPQRKWSDWPARARQELNSVSGVAGVGGAALTIAGWSLLAGAPSLILTGVGAILTVSSFGWAIFKSIPQKMEKAENLVGSLLAIPELNRIHPRPISLSIIGPSSSGKTTLRNRVTHTPITSTRTQTVSAQIVVLQTPPPNEIALLDGGGEKFAQQFDLSANCEYLCLVLDHSASDVDTHVDPRRLQEHSEFLQQVRHFLDESKITPKRSIRILINKKDLWSNSSNSDQELLRNFKNEELRKWKEGNRSSDILAIEHSNSEQADVASFIEYLKQCVQKSQKSHG